MVKISTKEYKFRTGVDTIRVKATSEKAAEKKALSQAKKGLDATCSKIEGGFWRCGVAYEKRRKW